MEYICKCTTSDQLDIRSIDVSTLQLNCECIFTSDDRKNQENNEMMGLYFIDFVLLGAVGICAILYCIVYKTGRVESDG